jgi:proteic killer suppression protein
MEILTFKNKGSEDIFFGKVTREGRVALPLDLWNLAQRKLDEMVAAMELGDLALIPGIKLETLGDARKGQHAIHIKDPYRICFKATGQGFREVEIARS